MLVMLQCVVSLFSHSRYLSEHALKGQPTIVMAAFVNKIFGTSQFPVSLPKYKIRINNSFYFNQHMHYTFVVIYTPTYVSTTYQSSSGGSKYINRDYTSTILVGSRSMLKRDELCSL
jgi:hypothetical protein